MHARVMCQCNRKIRGERGSVLYRPISDHSAAMFENKVQFLARPCQNRDSEAYPFGFQNSKGGTVCSTKLMNEIMPVV